MNVIEMKPREVAAPDYDPEHLTTLTRAMASWFVRCDNSFYDVEDLTRKRSRMDVELTALLRFRECYPEIILNKQLLGAVYKRAIQTRHDVAEEMIMPWNGRVVCLPGNPKRIVIANGVATINSWSLPRHRTLEVAPANSTVFDEFLEWIFPREAERAMFLNWLAWCL